MTPYSDVYKSFLGEVQDDFYASSDVAAIEADLTVLLNKAIPQFSYPKVNIRDKDDASQTFNVELDLDEIEILATGMVVAWARRQLNNIDSLRQSMTTKDFNTYSQAPHINALIRVADNAEKRLKRMLIKYSVKRKDGSNRLDELG